MAEREKFVVFCFWIWYTNKMEKCGVPSFFEKNTDFIGRPLGETLEGVADEPFLLVLLCKVFKNS